MKIIRHIDGSCPIKDPVVALGNFDGLHLGHQELIKKTVEKSRAIDGTPVLFTFYPHPLKVVSPGKEPLIIQSFKEKVRIAEKLGIKVVVCVRFTPEFASLEPELFVEEILLKRLSVRCVCVGHDYTFGKDAKGGVKTLKELSKRFDFELIVIPPVKIDGMVVSSTAIREFLRKGDVVNANRFLGRPYRISGYVRKGAGRGSTFGFPTANIYPKGGVIVMDGVYAGYAYVDSKKYRAAINVGTNPTFKGTTRHVEAFLIDFSSNIYGKRMEIDFIDFIRPEKRFRRIDDLVRQIKRDVEEVKKRL